MNDNLMRMVGLSQQGFFCSQILVIMALEAQDKENRDLVRAMAGLAGGVGFCGKLCGTLTGGACVLGMYAGKGDKGEQPDDRLNNMICEFADWFEGKYSAMYGGINCSDILDNDFQNRMARCPAIVLATLDKVSEILVANGYQLSFNRDAGEQED